MRAINLADYLLSLCRAIPVFVVRFDYGRASLTSCGASDIAVNARFYAPNRAGYHGADDHSICYDSNELHMVEKWLRLPTHGSHFCKPESKANRCSMKAYST